MSKDYKIHVFVLTPDETKAKFEEWPVMDGTEPPMLEASLEKMQRELGGNIEMVASNNRVDVYCVEEPRPNAASNRHAKSLLAALGLRQSVPLGVVLFCLRDGAYEDGSDSTALSITRRWYDALVAGDTKALNELHKSGAAFQERENSKMQAAYEKFFGEFTRSTE